MNAPLREINIASCVTRSGTFASLLLLSNLIEPSLEGRRLCCRPPVCVCIGGVLTQFGKCPPYADFLLLLIIYFMLAIHGRDALASLADTTGK